MVDAARSHRLVYRLFVVDALDDGVDRPDRAVVGLGEYKVLAAILVDREQTEFIALLDEDLEHHLA